MILGSFGLTVEERELCCSGVFVKMRQAGPARRSARWQPLMHNSCAVLPLRREQAAWETVASTRGLAAQEPAARETSYDRDRARGQGQHRVPDTGPRASSSPTVLAAVEQASGEGQRAIQLDVWKRKKGVEAS